MITIFKKELFTESTWYHLPFKETVHRWIYTLFKDGKPMFEIRHTPETEWMVKTLDIKVTDSVHQDWLNNLYWYLVYIEFCDEAIRPNWLDNAFFVGEFETPPSSVKFKATRLNMLGKHLITSLGLGSLELEVEITFETDKVIPSELSLRERAEGEKSFILEEGCSRFTVSPKDTNVKLSSTQGELYPNTVFSFVYFPTFVEIML